MSIVARSSPSTTATKDQCTIVVLVWLHFLYRNKQKKIKLYDEKKYNNNKTVPPTPTYPTTITFTI